MSWLNRFMREVASVKEEDIGNIPLDPMGENDTLIGSASPETMKIFGLLSKLHAELQEKKLAHKQAPEHSPEICKPAHDEIDALSRRVNLVSQLFWEEVRTELSCEGYETISIREGGKIVGLPPEEESPFGRLVIGGANLAEILSGGKLAEILGGQTPRQ